MVYMFRAMLNIREHICINNETWFQETYCNAYDVYVWYNNEYTEAYFEDREAWLSESYENLFCVHIYSNYFGNTEYTGEGF